MDSIKDKLKTLPNTPGVYFHKSADGEIIYVGKAAVLKNRVRQYFQSKKDFDAKTLALVNEIADTDWVETESEIDALFLESEMVKRYMPKYNVLLRDDKSQIFIRIDMKSLWPYVSFTRGPLDDGASYFGPYYNGFAIKKALRYLRKIFPHFIKPPTDRRRDLDVHIGLSPRADITSHEYKESLKKLIKYIEGGRESIVKDLERDMKRAAREERFEEAAALRNKLSNLRELQRRIMFGDKEFLDISKDKALSDLRELLGLSQNLNRIEGYDISHMSGQDVVASMVVFANGVSDRAEYRKFKTKKEQNNDFDNMYETIYRRLGEKNIKSWGMPSLFLIDGGKGQLDAAIKARDEKGFNIPMVGLAKKQEQIVIRHTGSNVNLNKYKLTDLEGYAVNTSDFILLSLPHSTHIIKLLQRVRDESHRFAVSYHTVLKRNRQTHSLLDNIPGVGAATKKNLLKKFGSVRSIMKSSEQDIASVVGPKKANMIYTTLHSDT